MGRYERVMIAFVVALLLTISSVIAFADAPTAVRPFLVECQKCTKVRVRGTGNVSIDSDGNPTEIISERVRCRGCIVEFRVDTECLPAPFPIPGV